MLRKNIQKPFPSSFFYIQHYFNLPADCSSMVSGLSRLSGFSGLPGHSGLLGLSGLSGLSRLSKGDAMLLGLSGFCSRFSSSLKESEILI
jgi:hypothetical protein